MGEKGLTTIHLKKINRSRVYHDIYEKKETSKQQIVQDLQMGLSTVSQNLQLLEEEGLIARDGYFDSTGGRKAAVIHIVPDYRIAIGVGILKDRLHLAAIDLYGRALCTKTISLAYADKEAYYDQAAAHIRQFVETQGYVPEKILGISIAVQGIPAPDHETVSYGAILHNTGMRLASFAERLPWPCQLEHDSKAAAALEQWNHPELSSAVVLLLNSNLGGAVIAGHQIHQGSRMHSGTVEHMCIDPDGPLCYCGSRGCLEVYCSAQALEQQAGMPVQEFFPRLREGVSLQLSKVWDGYLHHLAFAIRNISMVMDAPVIFSGYLAPYLRDEDMGKLLEILNGTMPFAWSREQLLVGSQGAYSPAIGAALFYVENFIISI